jgi:hypothetical protein
MVATKAEGGRIGRHPGSGAFEFVGDDGASRRAAFSMARMKTSMLPLSRAGIQQVSMTARSPLTICASNVVSSAP